jgi:hypothetical protein
MARWFEAPASRIVNFGWQHGRYADYWSFVHALTGIMMGLVAHMLGFEMYLSIAVIFIIATLYEGLEVLAKVAEDIENVIADIVFVTAGAFIIHYFADIYALTKQQESLVLGLTVLAIIILIQFGWKNYLESESRRKGSYKYVKLALYIVTIIGAKIVIASYFYWTTLSAY